MILASKANMLLEQIKIKVLSIFITYSMTYFFLALYSLWLPHELINDFILDIYIIL